MAWKFVITSKGYLRMGDVKLHRDLLWPDDWCLGGGFYRFDYVNKQVLIVKFNDGLCKTEKDGKYQFKKGGFQTEFTRPGYGEKTTKFLIEQTGERFAIPAWSESKH